MASRMSGPRPRSAKVVMSVRPDDSLPLVDAVITGASTGIGRACALRLDREGWRVFAGVRREQDAERLRSEAGPRLTPLIIDVTDGDSIAAAAEQVKGVLGPAGLAGLVNNAGIGVGGALE